MAFTDTSETKVLKAIGIHPWQLIAFLSMSFMYLFCYFGRYNIGAATPGMIEEFEYTNKTIGWLTTIFTIVYAFGQFVNGFLADRFGPKKLLIIGGFGCVMANVFFGISNTFVFQAIFWGMNGYLSSMLWAPCCRILYYWFPENRWGWWKGILGALCYAGGWLVMRIAGPTIEHWGWRAAFFVPPAFLLVMTVIFIFLGKSSPQDAGLEPEWEQGQREKPQKVGMKDYIRALSNFRMNLAYLSGIGQKFVRLAMLTWFVKILREPIGLGGFGFGITKATTITSHAFAGGIVFSILLGVISDRIFKGRRWQTLLMGFAVGGIGFAFLAQGNAILDYTHGELLLSITVFIAGGMIQGLETPLFLLPGQILGKKIGATGVGIMNGWMYVGASLAGVFFGWWLDSYTLASALLLMAGVCVASGIVAVFIRE